VLTGSDLISFTTIGASFTAPTTIVKLPFVLAPCPSLTVYSTTGTIPLKLAVGVKVYVPFALTIIVPIPGIVAVVETVNVPVIPAIQN
jgi:hypothetical protein